MDRIRLPRRTHAVLRLPRRPPGLARAQLLLRHGGSGRLPEGSVLPLPEPLVEAADGAPAAALELERAWRGDPRDGVLECARGRAAAEWRFAGTQEDAVGAGGTAGGTEREPHADIREPLPLAVERSIPARNADRHCLYRWQGGGPRYGADCRRTRANPAAGGSQHHPGGRR